MELEAGVVITIFFLCSSYQGITLLSLTGKMYSRVPDRRLRKIIETYGFGRNNADSILPWKNGPALYLDGFLGGSWEFGHPIYMGLQSCFPWSPVGSSD